MIGVVSNILAVVLGGISGALFRSHISRHFTENLNAVFGVCALSMGIPSIVRMENMPAVILAVVLGSAIGLALRLGQRINAGVMLLQKPLARALGGGAPAGVSQEEYLSLLVTAIVLFCASGTGIYGCLDAGMTGSASILLAKSILDVFTAAVFACTLGAVTALVAVPQAVIFTALFFAAKGIFPLTTPSMIADFRACGGFLLVATGLRIARIKEFPVADMIPAMALAMPLSGLWTAYIAPLM